MKIQLDKNASELDLVEQIRCIMLEFCNFAKVSGIEISPFTGNSPALFARLPYERQLEIFKSFYTYYDLFASSQQNAISLQDDKRLLWWSLNKLQLRPTSDLFDKICNKDIIEIYDRMGTQIYRNFEFFSVCSYTLDEIFSSNWMSLFNRDEKDLNELYRLAEKTYQGEFTQTEPIMLTHKFNEIYSERQHIIEAHHKYISPLYSRSGNIEALVIISQAKVLGQMAFYQNDNKYKSHSLVL